MLLTQKSNRRRTASFTSSSWRRISEQARRYAIEDPKNWVVSARSVIGWVRCKDTKKTQWVCAGSTDCCRDAACAGRCMERWSCFISMWNVKQEESEWTWGDNSMERRKFTTKIRYFARAEISTLSYVESQVEYTSHRRIFPDGGRVNYQISSWLL